MHFEEKLDYWLSCCHLSQACPLRFQLQKSVTAWRLNMTHNVLVKPDRLQMQNELSARLLMKIFSFTDKFGCFCACNNCLHSTSSAAKYGVDLCLAEFLPSLFSPTQLGKHFLHDFLCQSCISHLGPALLRFHWQHCGTCHQLDLPLLLHSQPTDHTGCYKPPTGNQSWFVLNFSSCSLRLVLGYRTY